MTNKNEQNNAPIPIIEACCMCEDEGGVWFIHWRLPILFYFDFNQTKITLCQVIPTKSDIKELMFTTLIKNGDFLIILAGNQRQSFIYSKKNKTFTEIKKIELFPNAFYGATVKNNEVHIIPFYYDRVIKLDLNNLLCVEKGSEWRNLYESSSLYLNNTNCVLSNGDVLSPVPKTNTCLLYEVQKEKWLKIEAFDKTVDCTAVACHKDRIYVFDRTNGSIKKMDFYGKIERNAVLGMTGFALHMVGDYLIADSVFTNDVMVFDSELMLIKKYKKIVPNLHDKETNKLLCWYEGNKDYVITKSNKLIVVDKSFKVQVFNLKLDVRLVSQMIKDLYYFYREQIIIENDWLRLTSFIEQCIKENAY